MSYAYIMQCSLVAYIASNMDLDETADQIPCIIWMYKKCRKHFLEKKKRMDIVFVIRTVFQNLECLYNQQITNIYTSLRFYMVATTDFEITTFSLIKLNMVFVWFHGDKINRRPMGVIILCGKYLFVELHFSHLFS